MKFYNTEVICNLEEFINYIDSIGISGKPYSIFL